MQHKYVIKNKYVQEVKQCFTSCTYLFTITVVNFNKAIVLLFWAITWLMYSRHDKVESVKQPKHFMLHAHTLNNGIILNNVIK